MVSRRLLSRALVIMLGLVSTAVSVNLRGQKIRPIGCSAADTSGGTRRPTSHSGVVSICSPSKHFAGVLEFTRHNSGCYLLVSVNTTRPPAYIQLDSSIRACQDNSFALDPTFPGSFRCVILSIGCPKRQVSVFVKRNSILGVANVTGLITLA